MRAVLSNLRQFNLLTASLRLLLAMVGGGVVGYGRSKQNRSAGFRTYILISIGAAMAVLLTLYMYDIAAITAAIERESAKVYDIDVERTERKDDKVPSAIFILQLSRDNHSHSSILTSVAALPCVVCVQELIA